MLPFHLGHFPIWVTFPSGSLSRLGRLLIWVAFPSGTFPSGSHSHLGRIPVWVTFPSGPLCMGQCVWVTFCGSYFVSYFVACICQTYQLVYSSWLCHSQTNVRSRCTSLFGQAWSYHIKHRQKLLCQSTSTPIITR